MNMNLPTLQESQSLAEVFVKSGMFKDAKDVAVATVKIMAGAEMGLGPIASLRGITLVEGKLSVDVHAMAALVLMKGKCRYDVLVSTDELCEVEFFRGGVSKGVASFTKAEAQRAGLWGKPNWQKWPKAMLYARAMSTGAKMFAPDAFHGGVYAEDEIEPDVAVEGAPMLATDYVEISAEDIRVEEPPVVDSVFDQPASPKQRSFMLGLLRKYGAPKGFKGDAFASVYPEWPTKGQLMADVDFIQEQERIPDTYFGATIKLMREAYGHAPEEIVGYCKEAFGAASPFRLPNHHQQQLINWIVDSAVPVESPEVEPAIDLEEKWASLIRAVAEMTEKTVEEIGPWFALRVDGWTDSEVMAWVDDLSPAVALQELKASALLLS